MPAPVLQFKRGNAGVAGTVPALRPGEPAISLNNFDFFIGIDTSVANNKFFGSHRYWGREDGTNSLRLKLVDKDGTNHIAIAASDTLAGVATYRLPNTNNGSTGDFLKLKSTSGGLYNLEWAAVPSGSFSIAGDTGTDTFTTGETLTFTGGEGIDTAITNNTVTISAEAASTTNAGIASFTSDFYFINTYQVGIVTATTSTKGIAYFNSNDFDVNNGEVALEDSVIKSVKIDSGAEIVATTHVLSLVGGEGIDVTSSIGSSITIAGEDATSSNKGIASFDSGDFTVTSGNVVLADSATGAIIAINGTTSEVEVSRSNGTVTVGLPDNVLVGGALTATTQLKVGTGVGITQFSGSVSTGTSTSSVPTSSAVIDYVGTQIGNFDLTTSIAGDTGTGSVSTSQTLTIAGTANEVETSASGQTVTVGLPNSVVVGTSLSAPTLKTSTIQSATGSTSLTIATDGKVTSSSDLTVQGNLYINGSTTQVNTSELTVYDRTITLGIQTGTTPSTTTWDLGVLMNYGDAGVAKTAGVIWEYGNERFVFAANSDNPASSSTSTPNISVSTYAPIEIGALWVNDCAGQSQVISCTGTTRYLENITIDAGSF